MDQQGAPGNLNWLPDHFRRIRCLVICILLMGLACAEIHAQGNIMIFPRRVVFEGGKRSQDLTLANVGSDSATYVVSVVQMRMKEDGSFEQITSPDSGQLFADKYIRFYPRTVALAPNKSQMVKVQFMKGLNMENGEYRSHIYFRAVPKTRPLGDGENEVDTTNVSVKLVPVFGMTIPVIVRLGESTAKVTLSDLQFEFARDSVPRVKMLFTRSGNFSVFGDLVVKHISLQGKETKVATLKGIAVYTPNLIRRFECKLDQLPGIDYRSGKLQVVFSTPIDTKPQKLAEAEIILR